MRIEHGWKTRIHECLRLVGFLSVGTTSGMVGGGFWKVDRFVALGRGGAEDQEFCYVLS